MKAVRIYSFLVKIQLYNAPVSVILFNEIFVIFIFKLNVRKGLLITLQNLLITRDQEKVSHILYFLTEICELLEKNYKKISKSNSQLFSLDLRQKNWRNILFMDFS